MNVAIIGYGVEGKASYKYWRVLGANVTIIDENEHVSELPENAKTILGPTALDHLNDFDLVIRTPPLRPDKLNTTAKVWSATNEFFEKCQAPIIGVTGTKGKGTTATLIAKILENSGIRVHLVGNIGTPALTVLPEVKATDVVVFELSSFQLWDLEKSPETAVVLMIEADHMDIHASMEEYIAAKANIVKHQTSGDLAVVHPTNHYANQIAQHSKASIKHYLNRDGAYVENGIITIQNEEICHVDDVGLIGAHNLENICAAVTASWKYTQDINAIKSALRDFKGLPHRLEVVTSTDSITFIDDSFSSAPGATIAAIKSFTQPEILICGGFDRGLDFAELATAIAEQQNIKKIVLIGQTKHKIAQALDKLAIDSYEIMETQDFNKILEFARLSAEAGDVIILSPGCASFDMFENFKDRGEAFQKIVKEFA